MRVFSLIGHKALPKSVNVVMMLIHIMSILDTYLPIARWRLAIDLVVLCQKPIDIVVESNLQESICTKMSTLPHQI
jgi:hypothetical protein